MKTLIDIGHPAHVHFFRQPIRLLKQNGHNVIITSRDNEVALELLHVLALERGLPGPDCAGAERHPP